SRSISAGRTPDPIGAFRDAGIGDVTLRYSRAYAGTDSRSKHAVFCRDRTRWPISITRTSSGSLYPESVDRQQNDTRTSGRDQTRRTSLGRFSMNVAGPRAKHGRVNFRIRLFAAMMLVVSSLTGLGLYLAQRKVAATAKHDLQQNFEANISWLHKVRK